MSGMIWNEAVLLGGSLAVGVGLMIFYDVLRIFRILIFHGTLWTGLEDLVYWAVSGAVTFLLLFRLNDGILRWYAVGGVLAGMAAYNAAVSRIVLGLLKKIKKYFTIRKKERRGKRNAGERKGTTKEKREFK